MSKHCPDWVDAEPFRAHVRDLICETGLSWRLIAAHAGVAPRAIQSLLHGRRGYTLHRLHVSIGRALAATTVDSIAADLHLATDITESRQLLAALRAANHSTVLTHHLQPDDLAQLDDPQIWCCSRATAARVAACYDILTTTQRHSGPPDTGRAARSAPAASPVESGPHLELDRKQTTGAWTTGSSSTAAADSSSAC